MQMARRDELDHQYKMQRLRELSRGWRSFVTFLCIVAVCTCIYLCVRELAGKQTWADIRFRALADVKANRWAAILVSWALTGCTSLWAFAERTLRKSHVRRVSNEVSELQKKIDPNRRSSGLSVEGNTHPGDL